jgi:hypothetical protein
MRIVRLLQEAQSLLNIAIGTVFLPSMGWNGSVHRVPFIINST